MLLFPCLTGRRGGRGEWLLTRQQLDEWESAFPDMDVAAVASRARQWLLANHLKTRKGMPRFLLGWLERSQNGGRFPRRPRDRPLASAFDLPCGEERSLQSEYGYASWEEWESKLRAAFCGDELEELLVQMGELRRRWETTDG